MKKILILSMFVSCSVHASDVPFTPENVQLAQDACYARIKPFIPKNAKVSDVRAIKGYKRHSDFDKVTFSFKTASKFDIQYITCNVRIEDNKVLVYTDSYSEKLESQKSKEEEQKKAAMSKAEAVNRYK